MLIYKTDLIRQSQLAVAHGDEQHVPGTPGTLLAAPLGGSDQPMSLDLEVDNIVQFASHLHSGKRHMHAGDFAPTSQMGPMNAHGQPQTRGPRTFVWFCSECGDGPYSSWQNACVACDHKKCGYCPQEDAP